MTTIHRFSSKIAIISLIAIISQISIISPAKSAGFINATSQLWEAGMPWWADSIAVEPGQEFKIYLSAGNYSETGAIATSAIIKHNLPTITLPGGGTQAVAYVPGSTFYYYDSSGNWSSLSDDGTSAFDNAGFSVTTDGSLIPFEGANYKYTVRIPDALPAGTTSLNWASPVLSFSISGAPYSITSENVNSITIENIPSITSFAFNKTQFSSGDIITTTASGTSGLAPRVEIGSITTINLTETSSGQYSGAYVLPNNINQSGIRPRLYMTSASGKGSYLDYGSSININTVVVVPPTPPTPPTPPASSAPSYSGGSGGSKAIYDPFVLRSTGDLEKKGDNIKLILSSGSEALLKINSDQEKKSNLTVSELTAQDLKSVPMSVVFGKVIANNIYSIIVNSGNFPKDAVLTLTYQEDQLKGCKEENLVIAHHEEDLMRWVAFASTLNSKNNTVSASIKEQGYYAIVCFAGGEDEADDKDEGKILGTSIGVYPNGTLLRAPGSTDVWYIEKDQKHLVPTIEIFESRFNWNDVIDLPSRKQIDLYSQGADMFFQTGTLIKEKGKSDVYRVSESNGLQPILSYDVFVARKYIHFDIIEVEPGTLNNFKREPYINTSDKLYTGDLVKLSNSRSVYYVDGSILRPIPSYDIFMEYKFNLSYIKVIPNDKFKKYGIGRKLPYPDGTLVKGSRTSVYVMSDQAKLPIFSDNDFEAMLYDWNNVIIVPDSMLEDADTGTVIKILE